ncbi:MAG: D-alanyl-D-alanine carboxypeptidase/D-alanyl-D-alanine-endopeptidase [Acidobacteria bacterium]|nr:MAG: D-alanyl-D-alanine carboxypeptidase/D-alanyl-D-alanine-endopeptidase [Acidobacteriota bacterium]
METFLWREKSKRGGHRPLFFVLQILCNTKMRTHKELLTNNMPFTRSLFFALLFFVLLIGNGAAQTETRPLPTPESSAAGSKQTLQSLTAKIAERLARPEVRRGQIGVKITSLNTGQIIFQQNAEKYFMPASNMKNFTVSTALEKLTPDFRFVTSIFASTTPDGNGAVKGIRVFGRGDISISDAFNDGDKFKGLDKLADAIVAAGVKRIDGDIIGDETYFTGSPVSGSWEWDDLQFYYGAEVSALPLNDNAQSLSVIPGPVGYPCSVKFTPFNPIVRITNLCTTTAAGTPRTLRIDKKIDRNIVEITGELPAGNAGFSGFVSVSRPAELFVALLKQRLEAKGVAVTGQTRAVNTKTLVPTDMNTEIAKLESPPLSVIAARTMKPSQNMYTETLLWTLGENWRAKLPAQSSRDSAELGLEAVKAFMKEIGVADDAFIQHDGSGLSRHDLITPEAVVQLYTYMGKQSRFSQTWRDSLTIGGVDGTLRSRFTGTKAAGNVRGKTGTIDQVSALSGYVTTASGEQLVFSMVVNGVNETRTRTGLLDDIVVYLANFDGKVDQQ